jgi:hypothetical protein
MSVFKLANAGNFQKSEELSGRNLEILRKYFRYFRHEGNGERTA